MENILNPFTQDENGQLRTLKVSEVSNVIKDILESALNKVRIKGEITGLKKASSGHIYFDLKEKYNNVDYIINAIIWKWTKIPFDISDGQEVIIEGKISSYSGKSSYNIIVESIEISGIGDLLKEIEERRRRLEANGIFDVSKKKPIPFLPEIIGVITSETGAVIRDILHRLQERVPVNVLLQSVPVQGENAKYEIIKAINNFNNMKDKVDLIIIARGGGSLQDLMVFNDEDIVMAVFNCDIPVISAIGHETDWTLIDYIADLRAPTPTAAAESVAPLKSDLIAKFNDFNSNLYNNLFQNLDSLKEKLISKFQILQHPKQFIYDLSLRLDDKIKLFELNVKNYINNNLEILKNIDMIFESLSFKNVLKRGYSIIWNKDKKVISSSLNFDKYDQISIEFFDGVVDINNYETNISNTSSDEFMTNKSDDNSYKSDTDIESDNLISKNKKSNKIDDKQGSLF